MKKVKGIDRHNDEHLSHKQTGKEVRDSLRAMVHRHEAKQQWKNRQHNHFSGPTW